MEYSLVFYAIHFYQKNSAIKHRDFGFVVSQTMSIVICCLQRLETTFSCLIGFRLSHLTLFRHTMKERIFDANIGSHKLRIRISFSPFSNNKKLFVGLQFTDSGKLISERYVDQTGQLYGVNMETVSAMTNTQRTYSTTFLLI